MEGVSPASIGCALASCILCWMALLTEGADRGLVMVYAVVVASQPCRRLHVPTHTHTRPSLSAPDNTSYFSSLGPFWHTLFLDTRGETRNWIISTDRKLLWLGQADTDTPKSYNQLHLHGVLTMDGYTTWDLLDDHIMEVAHIRGVGYQQQHGQFGGSTYHQV